MIKWLLFVISLIGILNIKGTSGAKMLTITLRDLLTQSDIIVLGRIVSLQKTTLVDSRYGRINIANLSAAAILKSNKALSDAVPICDFPDFSEAVALSRDQKVLVFGVRLGDCYAPILGYRGVCGISGDRIFTGNIMDEPGWQDVEIFVSKIKMILEEQEGKSK